MPTPTETLIERYVATNDEPSWNVEGAILKEYADRCLDCGYWTLLTLMEDGYCFHCWYPEPEAEGEW